MSEKKSLAELQEVANRAAAEIEQLSKAFTDNGEQWQDDEQRSTWDQANKDYNETRKEMDRIRAADSVRERHQEVERQQRELQQQSRPCDPGNRRDDLPEVNDETRSQAMQGWCRAQMDEDITRAQRRAMKACKISPNRRKLKMRFNSTEQFNSIQRIARSVHKDHLHAIHEREDFQQRAMSSTTATSGGEFVFASFINQLEVAMLDYSGILQAAEIMRTSHGDELTWPTANDTGNKGARINESAPAGNQDVTTGKATWNAYKYTSKEVLVPYELLEDSAINLPGFLANQLGERIGRILEEECTTGDGTDKPNGIVTASALGKTAASATAITADEIINLEHSVDPAYRSGAAFMLHDSIVEKIRLLKDSEGRMLWSAGLRDGRPDQLLGRPVFLNQEMDSTLATTNKVILFGQLSKYKVRMVNQMRLYRLEERYRHNDQDGFVAFLRADGDLLDAGVDPVKYLQMA